MKRILFIRPNMSYRKSSDAMQPLIFALLDALTPDSYQKIYADDCIEEVDLNLEVDLVAITVGTYTARRAYQFAAHFRKKGATVILGGFHVTAEPDEALEYADAVVMGDAEPVWHQLLSDFEMGRLARTYTGSHSSNEYSTRYNHQIFKGKSYFPVNMVQWKRGCKHHCDFCSIHAFYGNQCWVRPLDEVMEEIKGLDNKVIFFVDDNLYHSKTEFLRFLARLQPIKKKWACQVSIDVTNDPELVKAMRKAGCVMALMGIETFSTENLQQMKKSWNLKQADYSEAIKVFRNQGIMVYGTFIFGYDYDTTASFAPTVEFTIRNRLFLANFNPLYPMPGTELYQRMKAEKRLTFEKWWLDPDFYYGKSMFRPINMTAHELENGCYACKRQFNSLTSIFMRMADFKANARSVRNWILFLMVNCINRREIRKKQNQKLG